MARNYYSSQCIGMANFGIFESRRTFWACLPIIKVIIAPTLVLEFKSFEM